MALLAYTAAIWLTAKTLSRLAVAHAIAPLALAGLCVQSIGPPSVLVFCLMSIRQVMTCEKWLHRVALVSAAAWNVGLFLAVVVALLLQQ